MKWESLPKTATAAEDAIPYACQKCNAQVINAATLPEVQIKCPACGWQPVEVEE